MKHQNNTGVSARGAVTASLLILFSFLLFAVVLIVPATRAVFEELSATHPYLMGFVKFALLATSGELIAMRMEKKRFETPPYLPARLLIWGLIGIWITLMMKIYFAGTGALMTAGLLPGGALSDGWSRLLRAFYTAVVMNTSFGPVFMALHKCSDTALALLARGDGRLTLTRVLEEVNWRHFVSFTLMKTVPLFWIPAHTLTFLLPSAYQVMLAALLSVALGILLHLRKKTATNPTAE